MALNCFICKRPAADRTAAKSPWPFCSERCRLIDLGKWLGEEYRIPSRSDDPPEPAEPSEQD